MADRIVVRLLVAINLVVLIIIAILIYYCFRLSEILATEVKSERSFFRSRIKILNDHGRISVGGNMNIK